MPLRRTESGQAAAEFAAVVPLVLFFMVLLVEFGLIMVDQMAVERVAREAARTAAVTNSDPAVQQSARAASDLAADRLQVQIGQRPDSSGMVKVTVRYESRVILPFQGTVLFRPQLAATAAMRVEDGPLGLVVR
jgi:Flp pilus assembly protein TadG